jgi:hypothetical protein
MLCSYKWTFCTVILSVGEESEGCLVDCVNDCVAISELQAYKECQGPSFKIFNQQCYKKEFTARKIS